MVYLIINDIGIIYLGTIGIINDLMLPAARALRPRGTSTYTLSYGFYVVSLGSLLGLI